MNSLEATDWIIIAAWILSAIGTTALIVWFAAQMKSAFAVQFAELRGEINNVKTIVGPYSEDIQNLESKVESLTTLVSRQEGITEAHTRDIQRLESRIDQGSRSR